MLAFVIQPTVKAAASAHFHNSGANLPPRRTKRALAIFHSSIQQASSNQYTSSLALPSHKPKAMGPYNLALWRSWFRLMPALSSWSTSPVLVCFNTNSTHLLRYT
ncbi:unnamed protein product [Sphacelaria rigidula]